MKMIFSFESDNPDFLQLQQSEEKNLWNCGVHHGKFETNSTVVHNLMKIIETKLPTEKWFMI